MIVEWFVDNDIGESERGAIYEGRRPPGQPGVRSLADVDPAIAERVRHRPAEVLNQG